jgi:hypothetical protein
LPFQGSGRYGVGGGFVKESGGTGVFIPRTLNTATTESAASAADIRKKRGELPAMFFFFLNYFLKHVNKGLCFSLLGTLIMHLFLFASSDL